VILKKPVLSVFWMHTPLRRLDRMKRFIPVVSILLICAFAGMASASGTPMTMAGNKQIVFHFNGLAKMHLESYFRGTGFINAAVNEDCLDDESGCDVIENSPCAGGLGFRYFMKDDRAVRLGVNVGVGSITFKDPQEDTEMTWECREFGGSLLYEKYMPAIHGIAPYVGAGAGYTYSKAEVDSDGDVLDQVTSNAFDVLGAIGFQWYFTEGMSLGGEYRTSFTYETGKEEEGGESIGEWHGYTFHHRAASLFLGVHF
jgi:opacity protein-like surface antigen